MSNAVASDEKLAYLSWLRSLYYAARQEKRAKRDAWLRNYRLLNNRMPSSQSMDWKPAPRSSEIYPIIANWVAWATDNDVVIDVVPAADPHSEFFNFQSQIANDLVAVMKATWLAENYSGQIKLGLWDAATYGTAIFKSVWDNDIAGGYGNALLKRVDPWSVYPDPHATSLDDCEYLVEARMMSMSEIERRWPDAALEVEAQGAGEDTSLDQRPNSGGTGADERKSVSPGSQIGSSRWAFGKDRSGEGETVGARYPVYEFWIKGSAPWWDDDDTKHVESTWRVVVISRNVILMDEPASDVLPFDGHPYDDFRFDDLGEFWGISLVEHMTQPQLYINRLLTALQQNAEITGNPVFIEPSSSGISRATIPGRPGTRLTVNSAAMQAGTRPDWLQPPQMQPIVLQLVQFWIERMENLSGMSPMTKGQAPPTQRSAQGTVNTLQEAAFVRVRAVQRNLEHCLGSAARKLADLMIEFYDEPRVVAVAGPGAARTSLALSARHFLTPTSKGAEPLKYSLLVQAGATAPTSRAARASEAKELFTVGAIDAQALLDALGYPNREAVIRRMTDKAAMGLLQRPPGARQRAGRAA